ncbi:hypothetical protein DWX59_11175 [Enterocloster aldenensis]|nr:hypothetical protein DWX59_11175 [Enterocloster aldenensis]RGC60663.1 hypothetical protein DW690_13655 [Dorea longicatena]
MVYFGQGIGAGQIGYRNRGRIRYIADPPSVFTGAGGRRESVCTGKKSCVIMNWIMETESWK